MNFTTLCRCLVTSGNPALLIEKAYQLGQRGVVPGQNVNAFYLSTLSTQEIFHLSVWKNQPNESELLKSRLFKNLKVLQRTDYQLVHEYQLVSASVKASHLRLTELPAHYSNQKYNEIIKHLFQQRQHLPGLVSGWAGRDIENPNNFLHRIEWDSLKAQQDFFNHPVIQEALVQRQNEGFKFEYASFDLSVLYPVLYSLPSLPLAEILLK